MSRTVVCACLLLLVGVTHAREPDPHEDGPARQPSVAMHATILVTPDEDWQEKWNTPQETVPAFNEASAVATGGSLFLITFFENPGMDGAGTSDLSCDVLLVASDGTRAIEEQDVDCFPKETPIEPGITYMTNITAAFRPDGTEPKGTWTYHVTIKDRIGGNVLPLETSFTVN